MLKDILKKVAVLLGRNDISAELDKSDKLMNITSVNLRNDISNLVMHYNFIVSAIYEHYLDLIYCDRVASNSNGEIALYKLSFRPLKVLTIEDDDFYKYDFFVRNGRIKVCSPNKLFLVSYKFTPEPVGDLSDELDFFTPDVERAICYGVAGEFLSANGKFSEANFWSEKLLTELFKIKSKRERLLKSTYCL